MAFEGLLTKLGPSLVRELSPHLLQLTGTFLERFRKDTSAMTSAMDAEISSLRQAQVSLAAAAAQQSEASTALQQQLNRVEQKLDRLQQNHDKLGPQLSSVEEQVRVASRTATGLLWAILAIALMTFVLVVLHHR